MLYDDELVCKDELIYGFNLIPDGCITDNGYSHMRFCSASKGITEYQLYGAPDCNQAFENDLGHSGHRTCNLFDDDYDDDYFDDDAMGTKRSAGECCSSDSNSCTNGGPEPGPGPGPSSNSNTAGLSTGAVIGVAVGVLLVVVIAVVLAVVYFKRSNKPEEEKAIFPI